MEIMTTLQNAFNPDLVEKFVELTGTTEEGPFTRVGVVTKVQNGTDLAGLEILAIPTKNGRASGMLGMTIMGKIFVSEKELAEGWQIRLLPVGEASPSADTRCEKVGALLLEHHRVISLDKKGVKHMGYLKAALRNTLPGEHLSRILGFDPSNREEEETPE